MPITTNASNAEDKKVAKSLIQALAKQVGDEIIDVQFLKTIVKIRHGEDESKMSRELFGSWAEAGFPWGDDGPKSPPKEQTKMVEAPDPSIPKPKPKKRGRKKKQEAPAEEAPKPKERKRAEPEDAIEDLAAEAFHIEEDERKGLHGRNTARFRRGELMLRLKDLSQTTKTPVKALLGMLNERSLAFASRHQVPDFGLISEQEATTTRKVVSAFGSSGEFRHLYGVDPATGNPLVGDDGEPYRLPITEVAMNKLAPLIEYAEKEDPDRLMSFAHSATEKVVKKAKRLSKRLERPFREVVDEVTALRTTRPSPLGPDVGDVEVPPSEAEVLDHLREAAGEAPAEDVASIKTSRAWYEGTWLPIKALVSTIARQYCPDAVNESTQEVSNVFILERILTAFYNPMEDDGVQRILGALVANEEITEDQAHHFIDHFGYDPEADEWRQVKGAEVSEEDAEAVSGGDEADDDDEEDEADEDEDEGEDDPFAGDFDIDDPESDDDDEDEGDDDEDF